MSAYKELPIQEKEVLFDHTALAMDSNLVGLEETLKKLDSAVYALNQLKEEIEDALAVDPTGLNGLLAYAIEDVMHKARNVNFLVHAYSLELHELHETQRKNVDLMLDQVHGENDA